MVRRLFTDPEAFFGGKANEPSLRRELLVLVLVGALGAVGMGYVGFTFLDALPGNRGQMRVQLTGKALAIFFGVFVLWVYYTLTAQIGAYLMNSRGPISRVFKLTAWSLIPMGIANAVYSVAMYLAYSDEDIPSDPSGIRVSEQIAALFDLANSEPVLILAWIVTALAAVYSGYLLSVALSALRDLTESQTRRIVALPVAVHVAFVLYTLLTQVGVL